MKTFYDKDGVISVTWLDTGEMVILLNDIGRDYTKIEAKTVSILAGGRTMPEKLRPGRYIFNKQCTEYEYYPELTKGAEAKQC